MNDWHSVFIWGLAVAVLGYFMLKVRSPWHWVVGGIFVVVLVVGTVATFFFIARVLG